MKTHNQFVNWSMPEWAGDVIIKAIEGDLASNGFDRKIRDALREAAMTINRSFARPIKAEASCGFDLFRLTKSKTVVDICPNTLRSYNKQGLPFYCRGKAVFVSKSELAEFIVHAPHHDQAETS